MDYREWIVKKLDNLDEAKVRLVYTYVRALLGLN